MNYYADYNKFYNTTTPPPEEIDDSYLDRINKLRREMPPQSDAKQKVVILGAGPAGLIRAITSIMNGNPTHIIEKRVNNAPGRENIVNLTTNTVYQLQRLGVYQYLLENNQIFPAKTDVVVGSIDVRIGDLEKALKAVLKALCPEQEITHASCLTEIDAEFQKLTLTITSTDETRRVIENVGILINTEGSRSTTNELLGIGRITILPSKPAVTAIFHDRKPKIRGVGTFFRYIGISFGYTVKTIHYHALFIFKAIIFKSFRRECIGVMLKTPGNVYIGCGFSPSINKRIGELNADIRSKTEALEKATTPKERRRCRNALKSSQKRYDSFLKMRANMGLCAVNLINLIFRRKGEKTTSKHLSLVRCDAIDIGADRADTFALKRNQSAILLAGDAAATVDPSTGLGCNSALQSNEEFAAFINDNQLHTLNEKIERYKRDLNHRVAYIHQESRIFREGLERVIGA